MSLVIHPHINNFMLTTDLFPAFAIWLEEETEFDKSTASNETKSEGNDNYDAGWPFVSEFAAPLAKDDVIRQAACYMFQGI